ncbi:lipopolysaccharide heptosyltransferase II [Dethiosulfatarculus sandiegensis]|uniref:lipopolysaccharide heptosyltransferase II n=1 Tax=Dethiosulfatarculus sandiegensis TaxID=1429043 RepID=A0A0D2JTV6_9BACT|nr:lipopolysaccharide heptosyltransferase II [Dethiosulfatarculus sandiegensis]KIX12925.1 hypothetical protein X474_16510 [Dethiosulfatarculus sandiegensis]
MKRILIVKLSALGDVVQSLPVAMAIKKHWPDSRLDWLVESPSVGLVQGHPAVDRVLISPRYLVGKGKNGYIQVVSSFLRRLRRDRYDYVLDLQGLLKSAIFVSLARAEVKVGFSGGKEPLAARALNHRLPPYDPDRPALERYLDTLEPLHVPRPQKVEFGLAPQEADLARVRDLIGHVNGPLVVLHPVAKWESKLWPEEHWAELAKILSQKGLRLITTGSAADRQVTSKIAEMADLGSGLVDLAGDTDLKHLAALMTLANTVVTTDTGVMHLAGAVGAKVTALFGPTAPWRTGPHGKGHKIMRLGLDCSPCFRRECPDPECMTGLTPDMVAKAALDLVSENTAENGPPVEHI